MRHAQATLLPAPLNLLEYRLYKVTRRKRAELFAGCRRADDRGVNNALHTAVHTAVRTASHGALHSALHKA